MMWILSTLIALSSVFLIILVLIQRGRGGGLTGALGGMGGQSAFGTKAGDVFTRVTVVTAFVWIVLCAVTLKLNSTRGSRVAGQGGNAPVSQPADPGTGNTNTSGAGTSSTTSGGAGATGTPAGTGTTTPPAGSGSSTTPENK